jgi:hypothetical protein
MGALPRLSLAFPGAAPPGAGARRLGGERAVPPSEAPAEGLCSCAENVTWRSSSSSLTTKAESRRAWITRLSMAALSASLTVSFDWRSAGPALGKTALPEQRRIDRRRSEHPQFSKIERRKSHSEAVATTATTATNVAGVAHMAATLATSTVGAWPVWPYVADYGRCPTPSRIVPDDPENRRRKVLAD